MAHFKTGKVHINFKDGDGKEVHREKASSTNWKQNSQNNNFFLESCKLIFRLQIKDVSFGDNREYPVTLGEPVYAWQVTMKLLFSSSESLKRQRRNVQQYMAGMAKVEKISFQDLEEVISLRQKIVIS